MIAALDSHGAVYVSLMQANSNENTMRLFMHELFLRLDQEDKTWRRDTVLYWDGAGYHSSTLMLEFLEDR